MAHLPRPFKIFLYSVLIFALVSPMAVAQTKNDDIIIRDAEIENTLKGWLDPLLKVADINPKSVKLILVQNDQINAFVAGGMNIFIYTGLIERTDSPGEMIGVMAHELGHIAGGHLVATRDAFERASYESILGTVLGIGAAIATGNGRAAQALMLGGSGLATSHYLAHSRLQESSADQAALRFMNGAQINPSGLASFFQKLQSEELLPASQQSAYMRTHPLTADRIDAVQQKIAASAYRDKPYPPEWAEQHARMKAKLIAFINPGQVQWIYGDSDQSMAARYARAIAAYRQNNVNDALKQMDALIASEPANPYFQELKGQMLMDFGRVKEAVPYYRKAVAGVPDSGVIRIALGHALLETNDPSVRQDAISNLERALQDEPRSSYAQHLLATAYGQMGNETRARLHLAEEALLQRRLGDAREHAQAVLQNSPKGSPDILRARDILQQVDNLKKDDDSGN